MAFGRFRPFPKTRFGPGTPETGPNRVFAAETQQLYGKRVTWVHSGRPARRSFWVRCKKWNLHFGPLGPEKRPKRPDSGHRREKPNRRLRRHRNFARSTPWNRPGTNIYDKSYLVQKKLINFMKEENHIILWSSSILLTYQIPFFVINFSCPNIFTIFQNNINILKKHNFHSSLKITVLLLSL